MNTPPSVVIIGRINAGKSTFFNCLTETKKALVSKIPGTTRDYNLGQVAWRRKTFEVIDTGGVNIDILKNSIQVLLAGHKANKGKFAPDIIEKEIIKQTKKALAKASLILMVVDGQTGLLPEDKELALVLKKLNKPVILVCNKIDNLKWQNQANEFFKLGMGKPWPISAANGSGVGDLLDEVVKKIKWPKGRPKKTDEQRPIKVAMIGKPNTGKSSLVNQLLGEERVIVSPVAQTTREPQDTQMVYKKQKITLIDTAGLRKKARTKAGLEKASGKRALKMINSVDIILLVTEADKPLTKQDSQIAGLIKDSWAGIIIVANKWDLVADKTTKIDTEIKRHYQVQFPFLSFAPIMFISAKTGHNVHKILDLVLELWQEKQKEIPDKKLERILKKLVKRHRPSQAKGPKRPHVYTLTQTKTNPPEFTVTVGGGQSVHFSYVRFIENQLREKFGFAGIPIKIRVVSYKR